MSRICKKCNIEKPLEAFKKDKRCLCGRNWICKVCANVIEAKARKDRVITSEQIIKKREMIKKWREENKEHVRDWRKRYNKIHAARNKMYSKQYRALHGEALKERHKERHRISTLACYHRNKEKWKERRKQYYQRMDYRLRQALRARLRGALRHNYKQSSAVCDLGCSIPEFKTYLASKFQLGMTWDNWGFGKDKWNIDHIKPLKHFDLNNREQNLQACHYTNLQPLWQVENLSKGANFQS